MFGELCVKHVLSGYVFWNLFVCFQIRNEEWRLHTRLQMRTTEAEVQLQPIPSLWFQDGRAAPPRTPSAACAPSCCRSATSAWATTRTRPSCSSTAAGRVPEFAPTTISRSTTCCSAGCSPTLRPRSCGLGRPAAGPPTTRTWPSWITRTAGTRWRSCWLQAAAAWVRRWAQTGDSRGSDDLWGRRGRIWLFVNEQENQRAQHAVILNVGPWLTKLFNTLVGDQATS